jgi:hypothetical protein
MGTNGFLIILLKQRRNDRRHLRRHHLLGDDDFVRTGCAGLKTYRGVVGARDNLRGLVQFPGQSGNLKCCLLIGKSRPAGALRGRGHHLTPFSAPLFRSVLRFRDCFQLHKDRYDGALQVQPPTGRGRRSQSQGDTDALACLRPSAHRSTSPITMSIEPTMAGTSASRTFLHSSPVTARLTKLGPRMWTR